MNNLEIVRDSSGKVKYLQINGVPISAKAVVVSDELNCASEVTIILDAVVSGHTE